MGKNPVGDKFHEIFDVKVGVVDEVNEKFDVKVGVVDEINEKFDVKVGVVDVSNDFFDRKSCAGNRKVFVPEGKLPAFSTNFLKFLKENPLQGSQFFDESI